MKKGELAKAITATLLALVVLFPIYWAFSASFFSLKEFSAFPPLLFPKSFSLDNFRRALTESLLPRFMFNSLLVSIVGSSLRMIIAIFAAFAVVFFRFPGKNFLFFLILATMMLPGDALIIENYLTISRKGLLDSYGGIMSVYLLAPVQLFMLRQGFKTVPKTYIEVASVDGCSDFRFLVSVVLPLTKSIVLTLWLHSFVTIWNLYLWPLLVTNDPAM
jgi:sn-glycerol 3-phosphate transport system permease protein